VRVKLEKRFSVWIVELDGVGRQFLGDSNSRAEIVHFKESMERVSSFTIMAVDNTTGEELTGDLGDEISPQTPS
jgi:hypothetical protein